VIVSLLYAHSMLLYTILHYELLAVLLCSYYTKQHVRYVRDGEPALPPVLFYPVLPCPALSRCPTRATHTGAADLTHGILDSAFTFFETKVQISHSSELRSRFHTINLNSFLSLRNSDPAFRPGVLQSYRCMLIS
jgi:hypothetical protein